MKRSIATLLCALLPGFYFLLSAKENVETSTLKKPLITVGKGDLPIILSAPHGGKLPVPGVEPRKGEGIRLFRNKADQWTDDLTSKIADEIEKNTGKRPYVVIANFHCKFIDANRPPLLAYESDAAKPIYDSYHDALAKARREVTARWGSGLIIDVHGQASQLDTIIRGTKNGKTVSHLIKKFDRNSLIGKPSLFGQLAESGFTVNPPVNSTDKEPSSYNGGHIVQKYGSMDGGNIDAIQLELGRNLRHPNTNDDTATNIAIALQNFAQKHLPSKEIPKTKVGVYLDKGAGRSKENLLKVLANFQNLSVEKLTAADIRNGKLNDLDVVIQPGGSGGSQGRHLGEGGREKIRDFLKNGGGFIGICAGAYLASADYSWSLNILDAKVMDRKHWARGKGTVELALSESGQELLQVEGDRLEIYYGQGPLLAPANNPNIPDFDSLATFNTEIAKNGAPKGVMKGTTAIARGKYGKGRVICFSPHPELTKGLEHFVQLAISEVEKSRIPATK